MADILRRYAEVDGRRVLYRRAGSGPPLVMLHGSPGSSEMLHREMTAAAEHFTVFALDTPGFGGSDPLPGEMLSVSDLACATGAAMQAIGIPACPVYGTHTGALIALELGAGWPDLVLGLVMEGLPLFTEAEIAVLFEGYFAPLVPDPLGGHLINSWMRFRDQHTWFPWTSRDVTRLNPVDRPAPEDIDHWVSMFYRSCKTYMPAYRAACFHGPRGFDALARLTRPAVFLASEEDMLYPHLDRLPSLKDGQRVLRLPYDPAAKMTAIVAAAHSLPQADAMPELAMIAPAGRDPARQFVDTVAGQILIRCFGDPRAQGVMLLHDAPGSGLGVEPIARAMAANGEFVIVPDLPGCGESDDPPGTVLDAGAAAVTAIADALNLDRFVIAAIGCGVAVAAKVDDPRLAEIFVEDVPIADPMVAAKIAPDLPLAPEGTHWLTAWLMVRDGQIYRPWFDGRIAAQRPTQGNFDAQWLHDQTIEIMKARASYHRLPREAWAFDSDAALAGSRTPVHRGALAALVTPQGVAA